jgi:mono/diheme cytochrome c family protein
MKTLLAGIGALAIVALVGLAAVAATGWYDVGADKPHTAAVSAFLEWARERSVEARAAGGNVSVTDDAATLKMGAEHYAEMCVGCHLAPGPVDRELHEGLYPRPPDFTRHRVEPSSAFWIIKHGLKMTGMPAWGKSHDDESIRALVAFVRKLPGMDEATYRRLTGNEGGQADQAPHGHESHEH